MDSYSPDPRASLTDEEVRAILRRAAELEGAPSTVTVEDLRRIASEVGLSPTAIAAATNEVLSRRLSAVPRRASNRLPFWVGGVLAAAGGFVLGGLARVLASVIEPNLLVDAPATLVLVAASLILAARVKDPDDRPSIYGHIFALWTGKIAGWAIVAQQVTPDLVLGAGGFGLASAALAAVVMYFATSHREASHVQDDRL